MRQTVIGMSLAFGALLTLVSLLAWRWLLHREFSALFFPGPLLQPGLIGMGMGIAVGTAAVLVVFTIPRFANFRRLAREGFEGLEPRIVHITMIALIAGWSEELFFRGVLQPTIGIWASSLAFVIVHGVVGIRTWRRLAFAVTLFLASLGLGLLYQWQGLAAAMTAHAAYDFVVLFALYRMVHAS